MQNQNKNYANYTFIVGTRLEKQQYARKFPHKKGRLAKEVMKICDTVGENSIELNEVICENLLNNLCANHINPLRHKYGDGYKSFVKGEPLEQMIVASLKEAGVYDQNKAGFQAGSHSPGADIYDISIKSFTFKGTEYSWSGSRTTKHKTLAEKLKFHNNPNYSKTLGIAIANNEIQLIVINSNCDAFKTTDNDWEQTISKKDNSVFKTKIPKNGLRMIIHPKMSGQFWYYLDTDQANTEIITIYRRKL